MKPGIYPDISNHDYHSGPGISHSGIDTLRRSPAHYHHKYLGAGADFSGHTDALRMGTAFHTLILEPSKYAAEIAVAPVCDRRTKIGKETFAAFQIEADGKTILTADQNDEVHAFAAAMLAHPSTAVVFNGTGVAESSVYWHDEETGVLCRCRPDYLRPDGIILDFKSAVDASPDKWLRSAMDYGYHRAAAWYLDGLTTAGIPAKAFVFPVIEKSAPYVAAYYTLSERMIALGRHENRAALRIYAECVRTNTWPGYSGRIETLDLKPWDVKRLEEIEAAIETPTPTE